MSWVQIAHHIPERTRLRSDVLRRNEDRCTQIADTLATLPGVREVAARPYTGSVLVQHTRALSAQQIVEAAAHALGATILPPGAPLPLPKEAPPFSSVARKLVQAFGEIDRDVRIRTEGAADLGTIATFAFFAAGAAEIVATRQLPLPPWFNLAWWGYRTFMTTEKEEIEVEKIQGDLGKLEDAVERLESTTSRRERDKH